MRSFLLGCVLELNKRVSLNIVVLNKAKHVGAYKNAVGNRPFLTVSQFALKVTHIKSAKCNKLSLDMLSSLIRIKSHFKVSSILCENFEPRLEMMSYDSYVYEDKDINVNIEAIVKTYFSKFILIMWLIMNDAEIDFLGESSVSLKS
ncbi:hypothetical protein A3Q56_05388 [Intoshia linei]|uniref:Uncharacterized protein n=1 Tax=Intoshia linei TaxID=1819745 RepID=A0A177AXM3_9BILA|nr:hypothetical protein A3Q56_05388 [Intoshia linei]